MGFRLALRMMSPSRSSASAASLPGSTSTIRRPVPGLTLAARASSLVRGRTDRPMDGASRSMVPDLPEDALRFRSPSWTVMVLRSPSRHTTILTLEPGVSVAMARSRALESSIFWPLTSRTTSPSFMPPLAAGSSGITEPMRAPVASGRPRALAVFSSTS